MCKVFHSEKTKAGLAGDSLAEGPDQPERHQANPEVDQKSDVGMCRNVAGPFWQMGHEEKVHEVPEQHRKQRFEKVPAHCSFRHRSSPVRIL